MKCELLTINDATGLKKLDITLKYQRKAVYIFLN